MGISGATHIDQDQVASVHGRAWGQERCEEIFAIGSAKHGRNLEAGF